VRCTAPFLLVDFRKGDRMGGFFASLEKQPGQDCRMTGFWDDVLLQDYALRLREQSGQDGRIFRFA
jgi:hypothetical protein